MNRLSSLRALQKQRQYEALKSACLEIDGDDPAIALLLALAHAHLGENESAQALIKPLHDRFDALDADARTDLAAIFILLGRLEEAAAHLEQVIDCRPEHSLALARLGGCRMLQQDSESAMALFERSLRIDPSQLIVRSHLTQLYLQSKQYPRAQESIDAAQRLMKAQAEELGPALLNQVRRQLSTLQLEIWLETGLAAQVDHWLESVDGAESEQETVFWRTVASNLLALRDRHADAEEVLKWGLKRYPANAPLLLQLAELSQVQGRMVEAVRLLRRALRHDRENPEIWARLAHAGLHLFDKAARHAAEKAMELAEAMQEKAPAPSAEIEAMKIRAMLAMAAAESREQLFEAAEERLNKILAINPRHVGALKILGQQQMLRGRIDEAVELFKRIKSIDPVSGHAALINARHFPEDESTLNELDKAARTPSLEGPVRAGILFQLAAAWEKRKAYDKAMAYAHEANQLSKRFLRYDAKDHRNRCARIRLRFSRALYDHRRDCGVDSTLPVYVLGMPRSGTTLVEQIISGHSKIFGAGELGVIPQRIAGLNRWERHTGSGRCYPDCIDDLTPYVTEGIARGILEELKEYDPQADHIVDKLPHNFENIGFIKFLFPHAKIISVRRDPRDIAISNFFTDYQAKHGGMGFAYDLTEIGEQLADHNLLMHHWHQVFPGEILEINYEDVVNDLEGSARRMLTYIGVEWEPQVLAFNELDRPVKTASLWQVRQPIYKSSAARWKHYQNHLAPLIKGTNAKIESDPIADMITLPEPGFLTDGVDLFKKGDLDGAELSFKKMLHHNPKHAAAAYMTGLVYLNKGYLQEGIELLEKAYEKSPWHKEWRDNLIRACRTAGDHARADALEPRHPVRGSQNSDDEDAPEIYDREAAAQISGAAG